MMVQFNQSYSYEDFIMGYHPTSTGFELSAGPFTGSVRELKVMIVITSLLSMK